MSNVTIKGKAKDFVDLLKFGSINGLLEDIGMTVHDGVIGIVSLDDAVSGGKFTHVGQYEQFTIEGECVFGINAKSMKKYLSSVFKNDDDLTMEITEGDIIVTGPNDRVKTARLDAEALNTFMPKPPFKMTEDWVATYKKGTIEPTTKVEMSSDIFKEMLKKSELVEQNYFPMRFDPEKKVLYYKVGTNRQDRTNDEISSKAENIKIEGDEMSVILSGGFPEVANILKGEIFVSGLSNAPLWIRMTSEKMKLAYMLSPRVEDEPEETASEDKGEDQGE